MKAICYKNTKITLPNWDPNDPVNKKCPLGYAYEIGNFYVHIYGYGSGLYTICPGLSVIEGKKEELSLEQWAINHFGAEDIRAMYEDVGTAHPSLWRPGLYTYDELQQGLKYNSFEKEDEDQALFLLFQKLIDIFSYIEPVNRNLSCYGHRIRELIILACTEFENQCRNILRANKISPQGKDFMSRDFVQLKEMAHLAEFEITFKSYSDLKSFQPFTGWESKKPTKSLKWYDRYNRVKHDRSKGFSEASLDTALNALAANIILYAVRFGPYLLSNVNSVLSGYFNQYIHISLVKPDIRTFYVPKLKLTDDVRKDFFVLNAYQTRMIEPWITL